MKATACSRTPKRHVFSYMYIIGLCENINDMHKRITWQSIPQCCEISHL